MCENKPKCRGYRYLTVCHGVATPTENTRNVTASLPDAQAKCIGFRLHEAEAEFQRSQSLLDCIRAAGNGSMFHAQYQHYTTFARALQIFKHRRLWLTRGDSECLNDQLEWQKYGPSKKVWKNIFQASFSYGTAEHAFMWHVYSKPRNLWAVRISFRREDMEKWRTEIQGLGEKNETVYAITPKRPDNPDKCGQFFSVLEADMQDILYLAVATPENREGAQTTGTTRKRKRKNAVRWHGCTNHFLSLIADIQDNRLAGWIKDYEWREENETRIRIKVNGSTRNVKYISIPIPDYVLANAKLMFGPWTTDKEAEQLKMQFRCALSCDIPEMKIGEAFFQRSVLTGALDNWKES